MIVTQAQKAGLRLFIGLSVLVFSGLSPVAAEPVPVPAPSPRKSETKKEAETPAPTPALKPSVNGTDEQGTPPIATKPEKPKTLSIPMCFEKLDQLGVRYSIGEPVIGENGCGVEQPINILEIQPGVKVQPDTQLRCEAVLALANWTRYSVVPALSALDTKTDAKVELEQINQASTYSCRRRNNKSDGKLSEHSVGSAIDISGLKLANHPDLEIAPREQDGSAPGAFQSAIRAGACLWFKTVLGPGSDAYHDDHLHFDMAPRRNGSRYCR